MKICISRIESFFLMLSSIVFITASMMLSIPLYFGFGAGIVFTSFFLVLKGYEIKNLLFIIIRGIKEARILYGVILLIGATASAWMISGVVPAMMYYGFSLLGGMNFLLAAFLIVSLISMFMGTAVGTISTMGIAILGIGKGFGIPEGILMGVIVSGAFIADKASPISGLLNLTLTTVNRGYREVFRSMLNTLVPIIFITALVYYFIGLRYTQTDVIQLQGYRDAIKSGFNVFPLLMLLPAAVMAMSLSGLKTVPTISIGIVIACIFGILYQKTGIVTVISSILFGYRSTTSSEELNAILRSGGIVSMVEVVFVVMGAVALVALFESSGTISPIIERLMNKTDTRNKLTIKTGLISSLLTVITCDQTVGIVVSGRLLQNKYKELGLDNSVLARTISDTGTIIAPLMMWNINALIIKSVTSVSAQEYWFYAVLCYISPIVTIIISFIENKNVS
ncbi:MAG: Na+/H+ antiporter NhaC family protein [Bacillota bacterium]